MSVGWFSFAMALVGFIFTDVTLTTNANDKSMKNKKNTIKAGGSTAFEQNVDWTGWVSGYPLDCYDY